MRSVPVAVYEFGPFRVDTVRRLLLREGETVPLTPKAFEILLALIEGGERVVEKAELMERVWPDSFVEETNLTQNISTVRKALGEQPNQHQYIVTVPGRGYRFVAGVSQVLDEPDDLILERQTGSRIVTEREEFNYPDERGEAAQEAVRTNPTRWLRPALAAAILLGGITVTVYITRPRSELTAAPIRELAVLPFKTMGEAGSDEYMGPGMADALITKLTNVKRIVVRRTSAVLGYGGKDQDPIAAGRELKVDAVLDGRVQRFGDTVRATVQLVRVSDGSSLWAGKFDESSTNIFKVQDSISEQVAQTLVPTLTGEERELVTRRYTENVEAQSLYSKGRYFWNKRTPEGLQKGIAYFEQATKEDPGYALAYAGLADSYALLGLYGILPPREAMPKAKQMAAKAFAIDSTLAEAHTSLGIVRTDYDWDWAEAEKEFQRALDLNPNNATSHHLYGWYLTTMGRFDEAMAHTKRAEELEPVSSIITTAVGWIFYSQGRYDEAIVAYGKALELDPTFGSAHYRLGEAYSQKGMNKEAIAEFQKALDLSAHSVIRLASMGHAYAVSGDREGALRILKELKQRSGQEYLSPYYLALIHAGLGENRQALDWLEKAYDERSAVMVFLKVDPRFDRMRSDPGFANLLRRVGFAQ